MPGELPLRALRRGCIESFLPEAVEEFEFLRILGPAILILFDLLFPKTPRQQAGRCILSGEGECTFGDAQARDLKWMRTDGFLCKIAADFDIARLVVGQ